MSPTIAFGSILLLALLGVPIFVILAALGLLAFYFAEIDTAAVTIEMYRIAGTPSLITIPLFTFAGYLLAESGSPKRLLNLARAWTSWMPSGLALVCLVVCAFFTAFTGASGVTIIALGGLMLPILRQEGHSESFSLGLITTSGSLGLLFAPSLPLILYGLVAKVDIDQLFLAGITPGFLLIGILALYAHLQKKQIFVPGMKKSATAQSSTIEDSAKQGSKAHYSWEEKIASLKAAKWEFPLPFLVLIGIYGGYTTVSEAAAFTAAYVLIVECWIQREISFTRDLPKITTECMTLVGAILLILCCALGLTSYLVDEEIPMQILEWLQVYIQNKYVFLLFLNVFLLIVGGMMDIFSAIIVVVPLIAPIAAQFGIHPVHLAMIFLTNLEIGYITPPVGINLFISSFRFKKPVTRMYSAALPFVLVLLIALAAITYLPFISLYLLD